MTTEIQEYSKTDAALADLAHRYKGVVFDVTTRDGMATAVKGRAELRTYRVELEKTRVEIKAPALERCRLIDAEAKRITAALVALEEPIDATIKKEETRKEAERQAKAEAEQKRVGEIKARIADIKVEGDTFTLLAGSVVINTHLEEVKAIVIDDSFAEFRDEAEAAKVAACVKLTELREAALKYEADQRQMRADREEAARLRAAEEKRVKEAAEAEAAAILKRAEEAAAAQAELDRKAREAQLKIEAEQRAANERIAEQERVARIAREAEERKAAEARAAHEKELREREEKLAAERRQVEEAQRKQREQAEAKARAEREAQEKAEAEARAKARAEQDAKDAAYREEMLKAQSLMDARDMLSTFRNRYADHAEFAKVHKAIDGYMTDYNNKQRKAA